MKIRTEKGQHTTTITFLHEGEAVFSEENGLTFDAPRPIEWIDFSVEDGEITIYDRRDLTIDQAKAIVEAYLDDCEPAALAAYEEYLATHLDTEEQKEYPELLDTIEEIKARYDLKVHSIDRPGGMSPIVWMQTSKAVVFGVAGDSDVYLHPVDACGTQSLHVDMSDYISEVDRRADAGELSHEEEL